MANEFKPEEQAVIDAVKNLVAQNGRIDCGMDDPRISQYVDDLRKAKIRSHLSRVEKLVVSMDTGNRKISIVGITGFNAVKVTSPATNQTVTIPVQPAPQPNPEPKQETPEVKKEISKKRLTHTYRVPHFHAKMLQVIKDANSHVVYGVGVTGSGKTEHSRLIANELDMVHVLINCKKDMDTSSFLGDKTIAIDDKTSQNFVRFLEGPVIRAMKTGLDESGNETGRPALLVIDEAPVMPSWIAIGLNNLLENASARRKVTVDADGGRVVTSHSGFRILMLGNTIGRGIVGMSESAYTAQGDALDISTLDRVHSIFRYGYNRTAEESILKEKIGDDRIVKNVLKFRDGVRGQIKQGKLQTPFSTRLIVALSDGYRVWENITDAIYYCVFNRLLPEEIPAYNEMCMTIFGVDILAEQGNNNEMDYM